MQITVGTKDGKTHQLEIEETAQLIGKEIGEQFDGGIVGLDGYKLEITGGSDKQGFPMRASLEGPTRRKVLLSDGPGIEKQEKGIRKRKSVRGKQVSEEIQQLNTKVVEEGSKSVEDLLSDDEEEEE